MASDLVTPAGERRDGVPLLVPVMRAGKRVGTPSSLAQTREHAKRELAQLPRRLATLESMTYPVEIDPALQRLACECDQRIAEMQSRS
jgi:nicotinate phosphoribosyltransferase